MAIPSDTRQRDQAAYIESPTQTGKVDRRVHDVSANATLQGILAGIGGTPAVGTAIYTVKYVSTTAVEMIVGSTALVGRTKVIIQPKGGTIYVGFDDTVTAGNDGTGIKVRSGSVLTLTKDETIEIYAIKSDTGSVKVFVSEAIE